MIWLQRDPLGQLAGPDEYAYVMGEPRDYYDPMGLWGESYATRQIDKGNVAWGWAVGIAGGAAEGAFDGWLMAHDNVHFGLTPLHDEAEKVREEHAGEIEYRIGDGASVIAREALIAAGTVGLGNVAVNGSRVALYATRALLVYEIVQAGTNIGHGIRNIANGNYVEGTIQIASGVLGVVGVKGADDAIAAGKAAKAAKAAEEAKAAAKAAEAPTTGKGCPEAEESEISAGTNVTRNWGGQSGPSGQSWTTDSVVVQSRNSLGLETTNTAEFVSHATVIDSTGIITQPARRWGRFAGGGQETLIPSLDGIRLDAVTMPDGPLPWSLPTDPRPLPIGH